MNKDITYERYFSRAIGLYNKSMDLLYRKGRYTQILRITSDGRIVTFIQNLSNKKIAVKLNSYGQIVGYATILNPYTNKRIPHKIQDYLNKAIKFFKYANNIYPNKASPYKWIGRIYDHLMLYDEAIKYYKIALKLHPAFKVELPNRIKDCEDKKKGTTYFIVKRDYIES